MHKNISTNINFTVMNLQHSIIKFQYFFYQNKWNSQLSLEPVNPDQQRGYFEQLASSAKFNVP